MSTRARIATVCHGQRYFPAVAQNREYVLGLLELALKQDADLVCLPESFPTASVAGPMAQLAEPVPGPTVDAVARLAREYESYVICPLFTQREGRVYNSAVVIGRKGEIIGIYDKVHPVTSSHDYTTLESGVTPGPSYPVFDLDFGRIGIQICFDLMFAEGWAELARQGAKLVFWPSAYNGGMPLQMNAVQYGYYIVSSVSQTKAQIIDPCGTILAQTQWPTSVIWRDINLDYMVCHTDFNPSIPDRIMAAYGDRIEIRPHFDAGMFLVEPTDASLTVAQLQQEFGFESRQQYLQRHQRAYEAMGRNQPAPPQQALHGQRPMYVKDR